MRFLVTVTLSETGEPIKERFEKFEEYFNSVKPEALYFGENNGERTVYMAVNIDSPEQIPAIGEPLFQAKAKVQYKPIMVLEDIKKALQTLQK